MIHESLILHEFEPHLIPAEELPNRIGQVLWSRFKGKIAVEPPTFLTENQWRITPQGWVGHIPLDDELTLFVEPKVPIGNLFRMLEYAYGIEFLTDGDIVGASCIQDVFERLAHILASRVLDRSRKGFYREYVSRSNRLSYLRGKVLLDSMLRAPWDVALHCQYHENTADIEDNQILAWTLYCLARGGFCRPDVARTVRSATRMTHGVATLIPLTAETCVGRHYSRLNEDYRALHALCRFFLENGGPRHDRGQHQMLPFLIDMARLYEMFVSEWLRLHLPNDIILKAQETLSLGEVNKVEFRIDLLLIDRASGRPLALLDTKYKTPTSPSSADVEQVIAYATALGCSEAILVFPTQLAKPFKSVVGGKVHVWTTEFELTDDLEQNGLKLVQEILGRVRPE